MRPDTEGRRRRERWPPPQPISPAGRLAALTTIGSVLVSSAVWLLVAGRIAMCTTGCTVAQGFGALVLFVAVPVAVAAVALLRHTLPRPVDPSTDAGEGWVWGLAAIFALGAAAGAASIPTLTCPPGTTLSVFGFCAGNDGARIPATSWRWLRWTIGGAGVLIALTLIRSRRWVRVTAPVAAAVFLGGTGVLLWRSLLPR